MRHHLRYTLYSIMIWLAACLLLSAAAATLPVNGSFERGAGSITTSGTAMSITASAARNVIAWDSFDIASGYSVAFDGNDYLNFVRSTSDGGAGTISVIAGTLTAGGTVYLVNPWGINIKTDAVIDVEGTLGLSTVRISSDDLDVFESSGALDVSYTGLGKIKVQSESLSAAALWIEGSNIIVRDAAAITDTAGNPLEEVSIYSSNSIVDIGNSSEDFDYQDSYTIYGYYGDIEVKNLITHFSNGYYYGTGLTDHTGETPIATAAEFWAIADDLDGSYWLTDDVDLGTVTNFGIKNFAGRLYGTYNYLTYTLVIDEARTSGDTAKTYDYGLFTESSGANFYTLGVDFSLQVNAVPEPLDGSVTNLHISVISGSDTGIVAINEVKFTAVDLDALSAVMDTDADAYTVTMYLCRSVDTLGPYSFYYSSDVYTALTAYDAAYGLSYVIIPKPRRYWQTSGTTGYSSSDIGVATSYVIVTSDYGAEDRIIGFLQPFVLPFVYEPYNGETGYNYIDYLDATSDLYPWTDFITLDYDNSTLTASSVTVGSNKWAMTVVIPYDDTQAEGGYYFKTGVDAPYHFNASLDMKNVGRIYRRVLGDLVAESLTSTTTETSTAAITDVTLENDDGALSGTIEVTLTDEDGGTQTLTFDVTATLGDDGTLSEVSIANSDDFTAELSGSYDADTGLLTATLTAASSDGSTTLMVSVSDSVDSGSGELSTVSAVVSGSELTVTTDYTTVLSAVSLENDDGALSGTIEVTLTDEDGGTQTLTFDVTATLGDDGTLSEVSIANSDDFTAELSGSYDADTGLLTATLSAASSDGSTTLTVSVSDSVDDGSGSGSTVLSYDNAISVEDLLAYLGLSDDEELDWAEGESAESYDISYTITDSEGNEVSVIDLDDEGTVYTISVVVPSELAANYTYTTTTSTFTVTTPVSTAESEDAAETTVTDSGDQDTGADADGVDTEDNTDGTGTDISAATPETQDGDSGDDDTDTGSGSGGADQNAETADEEDASGNSDGNADAHDLPELRQLAQLAQDQAGELPQPSASDFADAVSATGWWWWDMLAPGSEERADASAGDATAAAGSEQGNGDDAGVGTGDGRISITSALTAVPAQLCQAPRTASEQRQLQRCLWQAGDDLAARLECLCAGTAEGHSGGVYGLVQP